MRIIHIYSKLAHVPGERRSSELSQRDLVDVSDIPTTILPIVVLKQLTDTQSEPNQDQNEEASAIHGESQASFLRKFVVSSGVYALSSFAIPLIGLVLSPFLTRHLSLSDYGALAIINLGMSLAGGVTQLNLGSALVRAYVYDYATEQDRNDTVATVATLLCLISLPFTLLVAFLAPQLANILFGDATFSPALIAASGVILLQNLTVPGMSMLRSENRPLLYSILSITNLLITLFATLFLVGPLHDGVAGAVIGNGLGYVCIVIYTLPGIFWRKGIIIRFDIAKNLLTYGIPLIVNFISYWVLQLLDRYLLSRFASLAEVATYTVAYTLGSVIAVV
ncbi:MAG: lipopolysaccharide biosynthesis protein, partial [Ktedonobacteraceae bacterium]